MVVSAKSLPRGNLGRNFAEHRGTTDLLQAGDAKVIIATVTAGSRAPGQAKELILSRDLCAVDVEPPVRRNCAPPSVELCFCTTSVVPLFPWGTNTIYRRPAPNTSTSVILPGNRNSLDTGPMGKTIPCLTRFSVISQETSLPVTVSHQVRRAPLATEHYGSPNIPGNLWSSQWYRQLRWQRYS
jgi:hypothetical protein